MKLSELKELIRQGESDNLEFKKTTSLLDSAAQTLCGFLNGKGGSVLFGVTSDGTLSGQHVSDHTLQEIAKTISKFETPPQIDIHRIPLEHNKEVVALTAPLSHDLTERQRRTLQLLSETSSAGLTFAEIKSGLLNPPADRTLRDDFQHLKRLKLIIVKGRGRGARWSLSPPINKAE
jgi:hypothetical protein